jgi:hypothetical protein
MSRREFNAGLVDVRTRGTGPNATLQFILEVPHRSEGASALGGWLLDLKRRGIAVQVAIESFFLQQSIFDALLQLEGADLSLEPEDEPEEPE